MKKFLTILILFFGLTKFVEAQNIIIPRPKNLPEYIISGNDTIGIVLTEKQVQKIVTDLELLQLLKKRLISTDSLIEAQVVVINEYAKQVALLNIKVEKLEDISIKQEEMITNLKQQIKNYQSELTLANQQIELQGQIIGNQKKVIRKVTTTRNWMIGGVSVLGIAMIIVPVLLVH